MLGLLLADGALTGSGVRDFLARRSVSFYENGPKKSSFLSTNHVLTTTGKSCANKKVPFPKWISVRFSVILVRNRSVDIVGHFYDGPDSPTKFR